MPNDRCPSVLDPKRDERSLFSESFLLSAAPDGRTRTSPAFFAPAGTWLLGIVHIRGLQPDTVLWLDFHESPNQRFWRVQAQVHACSPGKWLVSLPPTRFPWLRVTFRTDSPDRALGDLALLALPGDLAEPLLPPVLSDDSWPENRLIAAPFLDAAPPLEQPDPLARASAPSPRDGTAAALTSSSEAGRIPLPPDSSFLPFLTPHPSPLTPALRPTSAGSAAASSTPLALTPLLED
ncbi:MAG: hypothetical protein HYY18_01085 [Planctomycetes bacterium]|nr:hypothetical protein [Planctomycetota bacterium]